jgi:single-strand DNA-binding protein
MNKIILYGNVGKDPEVRKLDNGKSVSNFPVATSESYKNKQGEKVTNTEWHSIVAWSPLAEIFEKHVNKGDKILIEGKSTTRSYDDKEGNKRYVTEVVARNFEFGGSSGGTHDLTGEHEANKEEIDLPF